MNTFSLVQQALNASAKDEFNDGSRDADTGRVGKAVQTVVDALTPPDGGRYIVAFADITTAATSLGERRIVVSSKPLYDPSLSLVEKAVVIATFAAHEIGHTIITRPRKALITEHNHHSGFQAVANLADDIILEPWMVDRFPILKDAFEFTGLWVLRTTSESLPKVAVFKKGMTTPDRFNLVLSASRYGDIDEITWVGKRALIERDWARFWAQRLIDCPLTDHSTFLSLVDEAWVRIRTAEEPEPEPEPEQQPEQGGGEDEGSEGDESESGDPGEGDESDGEGDEPGESEGEGDGEDGESESEGDGESGDEPGDGESGDEPGDGESEGEGESDGESEDGGVGVGKPGEDTGDPNQMPRDWDDGTDEGTASDDEGDGTDEATPDDAAGGGGNAETQLRDEGEFDQTEVDKSTHDSAESAPYDWHKDEAERAMRTYASTTVTSFGRHGHLTTTWD